MANSIINYGAIAAASTSDDGQSDLAIVEPTEHIDTLTDREREVLSLIGHGATNREIAEKLIISEHTVKSHLRSILNKLNIRNRQQAAVYAEREGLIVAIDVPRPDS
jgi:DNA-binding NarL/FixJ family response regulator